MVDPEKIVAERPEFYLEKSDLVFLGKVVHSQETDLYQRATFKVERVFKGPELNEVVLLNLLNTSCSRHIWLRGEYFVYGEFTDISNEIKSIGFTGKLRALEFDREIDVRLERGTRTN